MDKPEGSEPGHEVAGGGEGSGRELSAPWELAGDAGSQAPRQAYRNLGVGPSDLF